MRPGRILFPTDLRDNTHEVLIHVLALCRVFRAELYLLHVASAGDHFLATGDFPSRKQLAERRAVTGRLLRRMRDAPGAYGPRVTRVERISSDPASSIRAFALEMRVDLIIVARGRDGRGSLGAVLDSVVHQAPTPVLVLPVSVRVRMFGQPSILLAIDSLEDAPPLFQVGMTLSEWSGAGLVAAPISDGLLASRGAGVARSELEAMASSWSDIRIAAGNGRPPKPVLELAQDHRADLLVVPEGEPGRRLVASSPLPLLSVSDEVARGLPAAMR